jgi:GxxExxY protein
MQPQTDADRTSIRPPGIIGCAYDVSHRLGSGFPEKVYENALVLEHTRHGLSVSQQWPNELRYEGTIVGSSTTAIPVKDSVLVELKAAKASGGVHLAQCLYYFKATGITVCILTNSGVPRVEIRCIVHRFPDPLRRIPGKAP